MDLLELVKNSLDNNNVKYHAIILSGSNLIDMDDKSSDYDILVIADISPKFCDSISIDGEFNNKHVDAFLADYNLLVHSWKSNKFQYVGRIELGNFSMSKVLYVDDEYKPKLEYLMSVKDDLALCNSYMLYNEYKDKVIVMSNSSTPIQTNLFGKVFYIFCYVVSIIYNEKPDKKYLCALKKCNITKLSDEYERRLIYDMKRLIDFMESNKGYIESLIEKYD